MKKSELRQIIKEEISNSEDYKTQYNQDISRGKKIIMYNPQTKDVKLTTMKSDNKSFNEKFEGYIPIAVASGYNVSIQPFKLYKS
jgi:predicted DNA-binding protein (MmcQ/YjbR family)